MTNEQLVRTALVIVAEANNDPDKTPTETHLLRIVQELAVRLSDTL